MADFKPTPQQQDFIDALRNGDPSQSIALVARAGCGKTSTILLGIDAIRETRPDDQTVVIAFNKSIATEVDEKIKKAGHQWPKVQASTLHSLGNDLVKKHFGGHKVEGSKMNAMLREYSREVEEKARDPRNSEFDHTDVLTLRQYGSQILALIGMGKQEGFGWSKEFTDTESWARLAYHYDINGFENNDSVYTVLRHVIYLSQKSLEVVNVIDFNDMILMPLAFNIWPRFPSDTVIIDEAQDLSFTRQSLARRFIKKGGRMIIVGDDRQAIYGFSGADSKALQNLIKKTDAITLPLSVTFRCPKQVVSLAQELVPDIEAAATAAEGEVLHTAYPLLEVVAGMDATDAILCRNTKPLIRAAYSLLREGISCKVEGRAIGDGIKKLATRWKIKSIAQLQDRLDKYQEREMKKADENDNEAKKQDIEDRVGTLREICDQCLRQGQNSINDVVRAIDNLFADDVTDVLTLCTYHRSKGREWPTVLLLDHAALCPSKYAKQNWQLLQEENLAYVAITRAQERLIIWSDMEE